MGRSRGFISTLAAAGRAAERYNRQVQAEQRRRERDIAKQHREEQRIQAQLDKEQRQLYLVERVTEAEEMNVELKDRVESLASVLLAGFGVDPAISFKSMLTPEISPPFLPPSHLTSEAKPPLQETFTSSIRAKTFIERITGSQRYEQELAQGLQRFGEAYAFYQTKESQRAQELTHRRSQYELECSQHIEMLRAKNLQVREFEKAYQQGESSAIVEYCTAVLEQTELPSDFPHCFKLAYASDSKELIVEYELPTVSIVPAALEYRYVKAKDTIEEKPRRAAEVKQLYQDAITSGTLRILSDLVRADKAAHLLVVIFNGFVSAIDPATGRDIRPCLISVRVTREAFLAIDLSRVERKACLRNLGAHVSPQASELLPVKPLVEFEMIDKRFVDGTDVLAGLDARPNLMDLTPFEFEQLTGNLFTKMGLEAKQTRSSRDGGVDVVAFDTRPVIGGKVVIQAKRYRHTVGVSAVRDLFGTMNHEGANKGILVSTSGYGPDAYEFIKNKPIELIDGGKLLYLLDEHTGVKARIIFPVEPS